MNGTLSLAKGKLTPVGKFFCKGCNKLRNIAGRTSRYSQTCTHCKAGAGK